MAKGLCQGEQLWGQGEKDLDFFRLFFLFFLLPELILVLIPNPWKMLCIPFPINSQRLQKAFF